MTDETTARIASALERLADAQEIIALERALLREGDDGAPDHPGWDAISRLAAQIAKRHQDACAAEDALRPGMSP